MVYLTEKVIEEIKALGERDHPHECGGMLIGKFAADGSKSVTEIFPLKNAREEEARHNRVLLLPKDVLRAERYAREKDLDVVGFYHSHPEDRGVPSQYDLEHALPVWSYVIVSVIGGKAVEILSWQMRNDRSQFDQEAIESERASAK